MGLCRGNLGNLMQHWVLLETLAEASQRLATNAHLLFVTSHSMAPWSVPRALANENQDYSRPHFNRVRNRLGSASNASFYERTWAQLAPRGGLPYPSSAVFALAVWRKTLSLLQCEVDQPRADEIEGWLALPEIRGSLRASELFRGDWRCRFGQRLANAQATVTYVEMDPMRFESHDPIQCPRTDRAVLFPEDLDIIRAAFLNQDQPIILQLSSYSANNNNPHRVIEPAISGALAQAGFALAGRFEADGNMISLVYTRDVQLWSASSPPGPRFSAWIASI